MLGTRRLFEPGVYLNLGVILETYSKLYKSPILSVTLPSKRILIDTSQYMSRILSKQLKDVKGLAKKYTWLGLAANRSLRGLGWYFLALKSHTSTQNSVKQFCFSFAFETPTGFRILYLIPNIPPPPPLPSPVASFRKKLK